jgi:hypothetical protein
VEGLRTLEAGRALGKLVVVIREEQPATSR